MAQGKEDNASLQTSPPLNLRDNTNQAAPAPTHDASTIHGQFTNLPLPTEIPPNLHPFMMPQDESMLGADALMNMPMMMPMMMGGIDGTMDANGLLDMPQMPQNGISNGKVSPKQF